MRNLLFICLIAGILGGCASSQQRQGKLKQGKPIPCPTKDC